MAWFVESRLFVGVAIFVITDARPRVFGGIDHRVNTTGVRDCVPADLRLYRRAFINIENAHVVIRLRNLTWQRPVLSWESILVFGLVWVPLALVEVVAGTGCLAWVELSLADVKLALVSL